MYVERTRWGSTLDGEGPTSIYSQNRLGSLHGGTIASIGEKQLEVRRLYETAILTIFRLTEHFYSS